MGLTIREIQSLDEIHGCEKLQQRIWGFSDISVIPHHLIRTTIESGGLLLGAFLDGQLIGFTFSFPGYTFEAERPEPRLKHCSIMAAVLPEYRFQGIGHQLKLRQREIILGQGIDLITWTFDPLQSSNAHFNFQKLGIVCRDYREDFYGDMRDELNRGLPSDRFAVEWWLRSPRVHERIGGRCDLQPDIEGTERINQTFWREGVLLNKEILLTLQSDRLVVEIPRKIGEMKESQFDAVLKWRMETRKIFKHYLTQGYLVSDLVEKMEGNELHSYYLLEKLPLKEILQRS